MDMTDEIHDILINSKIIIDTCSLMNEQAEFFNKTLFNISKVSKRKIIVPEAVNFELEKNRLKSKTKHQAEEGLDILNKYYQANLLEIIDKKKSHADLQIIKLVLDYANDKPVCVITEDKKLVVDILGYMQNLQSSRLNHPVYCLKISQGVPLLWSLEELENKMNLMENTQYKLLVKNTKHKMLLSIVLDNSASMKGDKLDLLKEAWRNFHDNLFNSGMDQHVKYEVVIFEGLKPKVFKSFDDDVLHTDKLFAGGVPILNKSIELGMKDLENKSLEIKNNKFLLYKPWLVLLTDGQNFGDLELIKTEIELKVKNNQLTYFPFLLSDNGVDDSLDVLVKYKRPLQIIQNKYHDLFKWIFNTVKQRIETPIDEPAQLDFRAFDGWIQK